MKFGTNPKQNAGAEGQKNRGIYYKTLNYRVFLPYGKCMDRKSVSILLNFDRKVLINTGVIECQADIDGLLREAGLAYKEIDLVINTDSYPEHIGLNSIIENRNWRTVFMAHPAAIPFIKNVALQEFKRPVSGFFKLVAGNTSRVTPLGDGQEIDLGGETLRIIHTPFPRKDGLSVLLVNSRVLVTCCGLEDYAKKCRATDGEVLARAGRPLRQCRATDGEVLAQAGGRMRQCRATDGEVSARAGGRMRRCAQNCAMAAGQNGAPPAHEQTRARIYTLNRILSMDHDFYLSDCAGLAARKDHDLVANIRDLLVRQGCRNPAKHRPLQAAG